MYGDTQHTFERKRKGAIHRRTYTMTGEDLDTFASNEKKIRLLLPEEPMTASKALSIMMNYAAAYLITQEDL